MQKPMGKKFRYYLTYQNNEIQLFYSPTGWKDQTIASYRRDISGYFGLIRSLSLPITFAKDGFKICRLAFLNDGYEAGVRFRVDIRQRNWDYKTIFIGDLDFSKYVSNGLTCDIPLMEGGISREIKAKENTKYEYLLEGADVVNIILPGVKFEEKSEFITKFVETNNLNQAKKFTVGIDLVNQGFKSGFLESRNTEQRNAADTDDFGGDAFIVGRRSGGVTTRFQGYLKGFTFNLPMQPAERLQLVLINTVTKDFIYTFIDKQQETGATIFDIKFDFNYNIQEGHGLALYSRSDSGTSSPAYTKVTEGEIKASYAGVSDPSNCKAISGFNLTKRVLNKISPSTQFTSFLLNSTWKDLLFTSGTAIRELEKPKIKISFKDLFDTFNGIDDVGFGSENGIYKLENSYAFARNVEVANIGKIKQGGYQISLAEELVGNVVKIGYNDGNTENSDGLQEYNSGQQYQLPTSRIQKEINWISPTRADQYGIEKIRVEFNITRKSTNDTSSDNDMFMIDCYLDGINYRPVLGSTYQSVTGLSFPLTAYNLRLTPKQNLFRHSAYLSSILDRMNGRFIELASAEKNADLVTAKSGISVSERSSIQISSLQGKYFQPYIFSINANFPKYVIDLIDLTPFGYISFEYNGIKAKGYLIDVPVDLAENSEREIKLLATADSLIP